MHKALRRRFIQNDAYWQDWFWRCLSKEKVIVLEWIVEGIRFLWFLLRQWAAIRMNKYMRLIRLCGGNTRDIVAIWNEDSMYLFVILLVLEWSEFIFKNEPIPSVHRSISTKKTTNSTCIVVFIPINVALSQICTNDMCMYLM